MTNDIWHIASLGLPKYDTASAIEALIRTNDWGKELLKRLR